MLSTNGAACYVSWCYRQSYRQTFPTLAFLGVENRPNRRARFWTALAMLAIGRCQYVRAGSAMPSEFGGGLLVAAFRYGIWRHIAWCKHRIGVDVDGERLSRLAIDCR